MDAGEFANLQEALVWIFGPVLSWFMVFLLAGTALLALQMWVFAVIRRLWKAK